MTTNLDTAGNEKQRSSWIRVGEVLLLIVFVVTVYFLGLGMVHHRFFRGGRLDQYGHIRQ
ncbi:MAG: hypothetical protein WBC92_16265 [Terracidiphilus sp.]